MGGFGAISCRCEVILQAGIWVNFCLGVCFWIGTGLNVYGVLLDWVMFVGTYCLVFGGWVVEGVMGGLELCFGKGKER